MGLHKLDPQRRLKVNNLNMLLALPTYIFRWHVVHISTYKRKSILLACSIYSVC